MNAETITWVFLIGGGVLMALELAVPGLIVVFFGAAAVITGLLSLSGIVTDITTLLVIWVVLSLALVLLLRRFAIRLFPSESSYRLVEDDVDAIGRIVDVVATVSESGTEGRISYNGTTWPVISSGGQIRKGRKARILYRDNISWVVEPVPEKRRTDR